MSDWRELRGEDVRPGSVRAVVRSVRASLRATHAVESGLLFVAGTLLARGAALLSGVDGPGAWAVPLLCGALAAAAWWLEHPVGLAETAQALDVRLRHHGALVTAFELERGELRTRLNSMEELVRERVLARLRPGEAVRAVLPPLLVPIAAPVLSALALLLVVDSRRAGPPLAVDLEALAAGLDRSLSVGALDPESAGLAGEDDDGGLSREQHQEIAAVLVARNLLPSSPEGWRRDPAATRRQVEELDRSIAALAARTEPGSELHRALEEARPWLDALRAGLGGEDGAAGRGAGPAGPGETGAGPDGTISGSQTGQNDAAMASRTPPTPAPIPAPAAAALGVQRGSWWPAEYDAVVERWIELSRAARTGADEQEDP